MTSKTTMVPSSARVIPLKEINTASESSESINLDSLASGVLHFNNFRSPAFISITSGGIYFNNF